MPFPALAVWRVAVRATLTPKVLAVAGLSQPLQRALVVTVVLQATLLVALLMTHLLVVGLLARHRALHRVGQVV